MSALSVVPQQNSSSVQLLGLDFGSTTSSMMLANSEICRHSISGRMTFSEPRIMAKTEPVLTPFNNSKLDTQALERLLDDWLTAANIDSQQTFAGASLITGLAARADNAQLISQQIRKRLGQSLIATADDPRLESWMAFMGNCALLSRAHADHTFINLDIGGGTTNAAMGRDGQVFRTGCHFIGARHLRFETGSYRLTGLSEFGARLLKYLGIPAATAFQNELTARQRQCLLDWMVRGLEAMVTPGDQWFQRLPHQMFEQVALQLQPEDLLAKPLAITFSGGVGELIYQFLEHGQWPETTRWGDFGIDLAQAITESSVLMPFPHKKSSKFKELSGQDLSTNKLACTVDLRPATAGRATVMGLTLHSCDISGSSLYLPKPELLPLQDLPIIARLKPDTPTEQLQQAFGLAKSSRRGACVQLLESESLGVTAVKTLANQLQTTLQTIEYPHDQPLVLLTCGDFGKTLGHYLSDWGRQPWQLVVIDEIPDRHARFVQLGQPHQTIVPVSFFGMSQEH